MLDAPDNAVRVPANADVDQLGRFDANGEVTDCTGFEEKKRWWDMLNPGLEGSFQSHWFSPLPSVRQIIGFGTGIEFKSSGQNTKLVNFTPETYTFKRGERDGLFNIFSKRMRRFSSGALDPCSHVRLKSDKIRKHRPNIQTWASPCSHNTNPCADHTGLPVHESCSTTDI
ncbi:hypothetical protein NLI96_g5010 [Meripilus lineatus]|uniref:Uncharacterized protein n=1 Tax=Meripilus lineatus TaxID=2056292 RepID=A0AAD5YE97_9APHY|nr:hypothetical protein NLI96_g5010 [Physisporinus lineatus]